MAKFTGPRKNAQPVTRRLLNRMFGGEITTPIPRTNAALRKTLRAKIRTGEYRLGEIIAPKRYKKLMLKPDGALKTGYFTVSGRKIPLLEILKALLEEHEKEDLVRDHSDAHYNCVSADDIKKVA